MPGQYHLSLDRLAAEAEELRSLQVPAVLLFGLPTDKDDAGSEAYADDGIVQEAVRVLKSADPELVVMTDVCLCEYTAHGHCGIIVDGEVVMRDRNITRVKKEEITSRLKESLTRPLTSSEQNRTGLSKELLPHIQRWFEGWELEGGAPHYRYNEQA